MSDKKICKCGDGNCLGFITLHEKELKEIDNIKEAKRAEHGDVSFRLGQSPSSGEIFSTFYELHILQNIDADNVKSNLDKRICDVKTNSPNTETYREFIICSEIEFGIDHKNLDAMDPDELKAYLDFLDDLWGK